MGFRWLLFSKLNIMLATLNENKHRKLLYTDVATVVFVIIVEIYCQKYFHNLCQTLQFFDLLFKVRQTFADVFDM